MNIDDLIATAQPRTQEVHICARGDLVAAHEQAVRALGEAADGDDSLANGTVQEAAAKVKAVEDELDEARTVFTVQSVARDVWANLLATYPPSKEQRRAGHDHDPEKFPVAAVAACVKEPAMTEKQAKQLAGVLPAGEWNKLWVAALSLNVTETPNPKLAAATAILQANGQSSTTAVPEASPDHGSLAGSGAR